MMRVADLKEAGEIASALSWLDKALSGAVPAVPQDQSQLQLQGEEVPGYNPPRYSMTNYTMPHEARIAAHRVMVATWQARRAALIRRAAQIGLSLETTK